MFPTKKIMGTVFEARPGEIQKDQLDLVPPEALEVLGVDRDTFERTERKFIISSGNHRLSGVKELMLEGFSLFPMGFKATLKVVTAQKTPLERIMMASADNAVKEVQVIMLCTVSTPII